MMALKRLEEPTVAQLKHVYRWCCKNCQREGLCDGISYKRLALTGDGDPTCTAYRCETARM